MTLILFGFKYSGKTYLGKKASQKLDCTHLDTDDLFKTPDLYHRVGESGFRSLEQEAILNIPASFKGIISLGGGAILLPGIRQHLQKMGPLVYLKASFSLISSRMTTLPAFASSLEELHAIYLKREPLYAAINAVTLCVDEVDTTTLINTLTHLYTYGC